MVEDRDFDGLYAVLYPRVVRQVYAFTGDLSEAQDCVQEAFTKAFLRWPQLAHCHDPEAWLRTVAFRLSISRWRKARNAMTASRRHAPTGSLPDLSPDHVALVAALRAIPAPQREAVVLHHLVGLSVEEISHQTGSPTGTVKTRLARGRAALASFPAVKLPHQSPTGRPRPPQTRRLQRAFHLRQGLSRTAASTGPSISPSLPPTTQDSTRRSARHARRAYIPAAGTSPAIAAHSKGWPDDAGVRLDPKVNYVAVSLFFDTEQDARAFIDVYGPAVVGVPVLIQALCLD